MTIITLNNNNNNNVHLYSAQIRSKALMAPELNKNIHKQQENTMHQENKLNTKNNITHEANDHKRCT